MIVKNIIHKNESELKILKQDVLTTFLQNKLVISTHTFLHLIEIEDILYIEACGNYSNVHLSDGTSITASKTLKQFESFLKHYAFYRPHSGYLINLEKLKGISKNGSFKLHMNKDIEIPLSHSNKKDLISKFQRNKI